ncbi:hypothetical protein DYB31_001681 [Aphanomyces astaci]|uniref:Protein kinase domain-containing protein n=1 Tax=Aphanomyces astaci TaxID=112090 RepID=A0A397G0J0_APHAT|nr:hypothetical protein DYB31_001681 [Aphanomyces astaci]
MNFLKNTVMGLGSAFTSGGVGSLPFTVTDAASDESPVLPEFTLLKAKSKQDGSTVSVFKSQGPPCTLTQNCLRRIKTLRHPNVLAYIDGTEVVNGNVFIVTEEVTPLKSFLDDIRARNGPNSEEESLAVSWGLRSILSALKFINMDCKMVHGRVHPESVFVTKGGDWKLGGFQLTGELTMDGPFLLHHRSSGPKSLIDQELRYKTPGFPSMYSETMLYSTYILIIVEHARSDWSSIVSSPPHAIDMYAFACTAIHTFHPSFSSPSDLSRNVPSGLAGTIKRAADATASRRVTPDHALQIAYFDSSWFIRQMLFLEQLPIKSSDEKADFYKELVASVDSLPKHTAVFKVLPALKAVVEFGMATGVGGKAATYKLDPSESQMLPAMVKIGHHLPVDEFKAQVLPTLVKLFGCNDRAVRVQLLQMMDSFAVHFDAKLVNSPVIFDNICTGFNDTMPLLRELTMKSVLHIADKLSDANLNQKLMKYFAKLQVDPEPAIRTNTTICLGKVATYMNATTRSKVLLPAFSRALKDPFPHARMAGLRTLVACDEYFTLQDVAASIIPSISPLMLDISPSAIGSMQQYMVQIQQESANMKARELEQEKESRLANTPGDAPVETAAPPPAASGKPSTVTSFDEIDDFADDGWGHDDLDGLTSPLAAAPSVAPPPPSTGSYPSRASLGGVSSATPPKPTESPASYFDDWSTSQPAVSAPRLGGLSLNKQPPPSTTTVVSDAAFISNKPRKTIHERKVEAKAKKEPLGASKLASKPKGGDNWDWDM